MAKTVKYTKNEEELIDLSTKANKELHQVDSVGCNYNKLAELLVENIGNKKFNKKLLKELKEEAKDLENNPDREEILDFLSYFTHKTRNYNSIKADLSNIEKAIRSYKEGVTMYQDEKISLGNYGRIIDLNNIYHNDCELWDTIEAKAQHNEFTNLLSNMQKAEKLIDKLEKKILLSSADEYKSGDILFTVDKKVNLLKNKNTLGLSQLIKSKFLSGVSHAGVLVKDPNQSKIFVSEIQNEQILPKLDLNIILESDIYRIDPTKLLPKNIQKSLAKIDYGYKKDVENNYILDDKGNKIKENWKNKMRQTYQGLSYILHTNQTPHIIKQLNEKIDDLKERDNERDNSHILKLLMKVGLFSSSESEVKILEKQRNEKIAKQIHNSHIRLEPKHWIKPSTIYSRIFKRHENDLKDLSKRMFNGTQEEEEMICSEFVARSICAVETAMENVLKNDLLYAGIIDEQDMDQPILKRIIPANEDLVNVHPGRLAELLEKSNAIEKITLFKEIFLDPSKKQEFDIQDIKHPKLLLTMYKSIRELLKRSINKKTFMDTVHKVFELNMKGSEEYEVLSQRLMDKKDYNELSRIYDEKTNSKKSKQKQDIKNVVHNVMKFCALVKAIKNDIKMDKMNQSKDISTLAQDNIAQKDKANNKAVKGKHTAKLEESRNNEEANDKKNTR